MKTFKIYLLTAIAFMLTACIEKPDEPYTPPTPPNTNEGMEFTFHIDKTINNVIYPSDTIEGHVFPFTVEAEEQLPELTVIAPETDELKIEVSVAEDNMSGTITVTGTDKFVSDALDLTFKANCGRYVSTDLINIEKACFETDSKKQYVFSSQGGYQSMHLKTNLDYEISIEGELKDYLTVEKEKGRISITAKERNEWNDKEAWMKISEPKGLFDDIDVLIQQASFRGSRATDSLALVQIYHELDLQYSHNMGMHGRMQYWLTDAPIDKWLGVWVSMGRVIGLDLNMVHHDPEWKEYHYHLPECIGNLKYLQHFKFSGPIAGELPKCFADLDHLKELEIYGPNKLTGKLEDHPIGKYASQIKFWCVDGVFQGGVPEWFSQFYSYRFECNSFSGRVPEPVENSESMQDLKINCSIDKEGHAPDDLEQWWPTLYETPVLDWLNKDPSYWTNGVGSIPDIVYWDWINAYQEFLDIDYHTIRIFDWSKYAIWCDIDMPEGVVKINGQYGEHYEWESREALLNYLENVRGYINIRKHTGYKEDKEMIEYYDDFRQLVN